MVQRIFVLNLNQISQTFFKFNLNVINTNGWMDNVDDLDVINKKNWFVLNSEIILREFRDTPSTYFWKIFVRQYCWGHFERKIRFKSLQHFVRVYQWTYNYFFTIFNLLESIAFLWQFLNECWRTLEKLCAKQHSKPFNGSGQTMMSKCLVFGLFRFRLSISKTC